MNMRLDVDELKRSIDGLLIAYPELAEDEQLRADVLEGETDIHSVLSRLTGLAADARMMVEAIKARGAEIAARKARYERQDEAMRNLIADIMDRASINKVVLPEATLSISFRAPAPQVVNEDALPAECVTLVRKPVMATIKAWCEAGNMPEGVVMSNGKSVLTIRKT